MPDSIRSTSGEPLNALYGFANFLIGLLEKSKGEYFAIAFDESLDTSFRNQLYPAYKSNRESPPDELLNQFNLCKQLAGLLGLSVFSSCKFEADDLIGTIAGKMRPKNFRMIFVSSDKDLAQLMEPSDIFWNYASDLQLRIGDIKKKYGVHARQIRDWLALAGDSIDNIPGVPGIGNKTAARLLERYESLEGIYKNLAKIRESNLRGSNRIHALLNDHMELALVSQQLATIHTGASIQCTVRTLKRKNIRPNRIHEFCDQIGSGNNLRNRLLGTKIKYT